MADQHPRIPTLDLGAFETDRSAFVQKLGAAFKEYGFVGIENHGIPEAVINDAYDVFRDFFALPAATKQRYHLPGKGGARGYTGFGVEGAKDSALGDLKEFWHFGRDLPEAQQKRYGAVMPPNLLVSEVPDFNPKGMRLYDALDGVGGVVLRAVALYLGQPEGFFDERIRFGNSILRPIHYPPIADLDTPAVRACAHEDINLITLLVGSGEPGLQIQSRKGEWIPVDTIPGTVVCNIGDMLQRITNDGLPSTTHRVVNPTGAGRREARYSIPFFLHPNPDVVLEVLPGCAGPGNPSRYPKPIVSQDYLTQRLFEIGLIDKLPPHLEAESGTKGGRKG
jgi:isopenicillin N synthase-like dioxygenase